jgi:hypothetical protein
MRMVWSTVYVPRKRSARSFPHVFSSKLAIEEAAEVLGPPSERCGSCGAGSLSRAKAITTKRSFLCTARLAIAAGRTTTRA